MIVDYFLFTSCGNDSVALMQWAFEEGLENVLVVYNDTGWHAPEWEERIEQIDQLAGDMGFMFTRTESVGMKELCRSKQTTPKFRQQFCTEELKLKPSLKLMDEHDPDREATVLVGVRREESARRATFPEYSDDSPAHGMRLCWAPLVRHTEQMRDALLDRAEVEKLPHRSRECYPCIYQRKEGIAEMREEDIIKVEEVEEITGRSWFNPNSKLGAKNIREAVKWARTNNRKRTAEEKEGCDSGYCGT